MRNIKKINLSWMFLKKNVSYDLLNDKEFIKIDLPHTWNGIDGQDGGNDYIRDAFWYRKTFNKTELPEGLKKFIEFKGVNASADVYLNGKLVGHHDGGYSTFRFDITSFIEDENTLMLHVDNSVNDRVYPQKADFTFYGGIYRDVSFIGLDDNHFDVLHYGSKGAKVNAHVVDGKGHLELETYVVGSGKVLVEIKDQEGKSVYKGDAVNPIVLDDVHLWQGIEDPYLYTVEIKLKDGNKVLDNIEYHVGFRSFYFDPNDGFYLNDKKYPLRGVCRHQDRPNIGNALTTKEHEEDIELIKEVGANTIRLAHYQHDDYFYDLCDKEGFVIWAEIPYISKHMNNANENAREQMRELIIQQYHRPSIVTWGISNEITISFAGKDCLAFHKEMNDLVHDLDASRKTVIADYMPARINNKLNRVPDVVSYNLYFGWYLPFTSLAGWKLDRYHKKYPNEILGLSEYGAEGVDKVFNKYPRRGDNTEAYQAIYHERMLDIINARDYIWGTHVWNMFDFAADARNQGGEPGMNHKGLVTFDRKRRKDAFYIYKANWSKDPFVHVCDKAYEMRTGRKTKIKVYSNQDNVEVYHNGELVFNGKPTNHKVEVKVVMAKENHVVVKSNDLQDESKFIKVNKKPSQYKIKKTKNVSWEK